MSLASLPSRVSVTAPLGLPEVAAEPLNVGIVWDAENRLTAVNQGPTTLASFLYDGAGRRHQKVAGGVTHTYIPDGSSIMEERFSTGQTLRYVEGPSIDQHLAMQDGAAVTYYVADHLGSVTQETSSAGAVTLARKYDPWGNPLAGASAAGWSFTGREWDAETGIAYYRARYYDPKAGRFTSEDPAGRIDGTNAYRYVRNRPVLLVDPLGLCTCTDPCPSGKWVVDTLSVTFGAGFVLQFGLGHLTCQGNPAVSRWARVGCVLLGAMVAASAGVSVQIDGVAISGPCRPEDLGVVKTRSVVGDFGPVSAEVQDGQLQAVGASAGYSGGIATAECYIHPL